MRTFHHGEGDARKRWTIELAGKAYTTVSHAPGKPDRKHTTTCPSKKEAEAAAERLIARKVREGYRETTPTPLQHAVEAALIDNPDDPSNHAAYADLLMEQGDPRGEFISVQFALERPGLSSVERGRLEKREKALLKQHGRDWMGALAEVLVGAEARNVTGYRWGSGWLEGLHVGYLPLATAPLLASAPELRLLRELRIDWAEHPHRRGAQGPIGSLAKSTVLGNVRHLRLGQDSDADDWLFPLGSDIGCPTLPAVVARMPRLEELYLWATGYDVGKLFDLPLSRLRVLKVYHVLGRYPLERLAANPAMANLTHLLLQPPRLTSFDPASIDEIGLRALAESPHLGNLTHLQLRMSTVGDAGCAALVESGLLERLTVLDLRCGTVTDEGAHILAACPATRRLERLDLTCNRLTAAGVAALQGLGIEVRAEHQTDHDVYFYEVDFE